MDSAKFLQNLNFFQNLDLSDSWSKIKAFDTAGLMGDKVSSAFAVLGLVTAAQVAWTPIRGFYKHFLRRSNDLKNKYGGEWAIVTGASDGIGEAMCYELAAKGYNIILMARTVEKMEKVAKVCEDTHKVQTKIVQFDFATLSNIEGVETLKTVLEDLKKLDISVLVNNVGKANASYIHEHSSQMIFQMIHVNICSQTFMSVFTVPLLLDRFEKQGKKSAIINFSSSSVFDEDARISIYAATKAYNHVFSECMRKEYEGKIDILTVVPRSVKTQMNSGIYAFTIMPDMHAKSVVEEVGRVNVTWGHYHHGLQNWLFGIPPMRALIKHQDKQRQLEWMAKRKALAAAQEVTKTSVVSEEKAEAPVASQKEEKAAE